MFVYRKYFCFFLHFTYKMPRYSAAERRAYAAGARKSVRRGLQMSRRTGIPYVRGNGGYEIVVPAKTRKGGFNAVKTGGNIGRSLGAGAGMLAAEAANLVAPGVGFLAPAASMVGSKAGEYLGRVGGKLFRQITGFGDYAIQANSLLDTGPAMFGDNSIRIRNRELVGFIEGHSTFFNDPFPVNPGMASCFPYLSHIANAFQMWQPHGLIFEYMPLAYNAVASTNVSSGAVVIASNYVADEVNYASVQAAMTSQFANVSRPSTRFIHAIECARRDTAQKWYYVRAGAIPANADLKLYDLCKTQVITEGQDPATRQIGALWVSYDITLSKTAAVAFTGSDLQACHATGLNQTALAPFNEATFQEGSNLELEITDDSVAFPPNMGSGRFIWVYGAIAGSTAALVGPTYTYAGCHSVNNIFFSDSTSTMNNYGVTDNVMLDIRFINITAEDASITLSGGTYPTTTGTVSWDLVVCQIPVDMGGFSQVMEAITKKIPRSKLLLMQQQKIDRLLSNPDDEDRITVIPEEVQPISRRQSMEVKRR